MWNLSSILVWSGRTPEPGKAARPVSRTSSTPLCPASVRPDAQSSNSAANRSRWLRLRSFQRAATGRSARSAGRLRECAAPRRSSLRQCGMAKSSGSAQDCRQRKGPYFLDARAGFHRYRRTGPQRGGSTCGPRRPRSDVPGPCHLAARRRAGSTSSSPGRRPLRRGSRRARHRLAPRGGVRHLLVDQRLPSETRWDPVVPVGAVAATAAGTCVLDQPVPR